ncbi:MAG TPA: protein kinase [Anaerolineaceae bacterium]|nr:protein kinase [Anaerolineaceae bacterium]
MALAPGSFLNNRYRIVSVLGQGGMGSVYHAIDENLGTPVAVKENLFLTEEYSRQFQREGSILASLRHPCLPRVGDYFVIPGEGQYLIMDYIDGEDLRQRIERLGTLSEREVILIGAGICDALDYMHTRKPAVLHRDIKPGNIKITPEGEVILVDFGLAKVMRGSQATTTGARAMTPGYSPPEQYGTARTDPRSDIYSLGATLYAALTGIIPEDGLARATGKVQLTPLRTLQPRANKKVANVIEKALAVEPNDRYQTAGEFKRALLEAGEISHVYPEKLRIPPAPLLTSTMPVEPDSDPIEHERDFEDQFPIARKSAQKSKPKRQKNFFQYSVITLIIILLGLLVYMKPDLPIAIAAVFVSSPTPVITQKSPASQIVASPTDIVIPTRTAIISASPVPVTIVPSPFPIILPSPTITPQPTPTLIGGGEEPQIAFASDRVNNILQIFSMNADGSDQKAITNLPEGACQPTWSPDGSQLAFISPCSIIDRKTDSYKGSQIFITNIDGSNVHLLPIPPSPEGDFEPAWSPDGKNIAFVSLRTGISHIFVVNLDNCQNPDSCDIKDVSNSHYADKQPAWFPDGTQIVFIRQYSFSQVWMVSADGKTSEQFRTQSVSFNDLWPAWSPDGDYLFLSQMTINPSPPWLVRIPYRERSINQGERIIPLGKNTLPIAGVSVSPDNKWLIFESWPDGSNHDIYRMNLDGSLYIRLTNDPGFDFGATWRPIAVH